MSPLAKFKLLLSAATLLTSLGLAVFLHAVLPLAGSELWRVIAFATSCPFLLSTFAFVLAKGSMQKERLADSNDEGLFKAITNQSCEGIGVADIEGAYTFVNPAFCKMMGYSEQELLNMTVFDVKAKSQDKSSFNESKTSKAGEAIQVYLRRKDGTEFYSEVMGQMIEVNGQTAVLGTVRDITDRLQHDEEKRSLERQLLHAQKLESLGILAGGIAHDFNNMLMAILGNTDLALADLEPTSPARESLLEIEHVTRRAAELARQMLAYSGKGCFVVEPVNLSELVRETAHLLEVSISKKVHLRFDLAENLPTFDGDVTQVRQVVMNLITNASEAIGEDSGVVSLSTGTQQCDRAYLDSGAIIAGPSPDAPPSEGLYAYLEVSDTGCGMEAETIEKVFDPFFTTKFAGRGLGMSAAQGIVSGHKGLIRVESEPGRGTTFRVLFRAEPRPNGGAEPRPSRPHEVGETTDSRAYGTVLIVDDEDTILQVARRMVERMGPCVLTASDGIEALKIFKQHADEVTCVLLDLTMPRMDGLQTFLELQLVRDDVAVILCSGYSETDAMQRFSGKGLAGFLQKPFDMAALKTMLEGISPCSR